MDIVFIMKSDYIDKVVECCIEREKVLFNKQPISKYNRLYDKMIRYVKKVIEENNQEKLIILLILPCTSDDFVISVHIG